MKPITKPANTRLKSEIAQRLAQVQERIAAACARARRDPAQIVLVAVSKEVPPEKIAEAYELGLRDFGENYWQQAREKIPLLPADIRWHFIGHLQTNKAKYVVGTFALIQSVDRIELVQELQKQASKKQVIQPVLIEVKLSEEATKFGVDPEQVPALVEAIQLQSHLRLMGLMGMAPLVQKPEEARPYFARLRRLFENLEPNHRVHLSMGMTQDFEIAIEEGSTMVRLGTALFGERPQADR